MKTPWKGSRAHSEAAPPGTAAYVLGVDRHVQVGGEHPDHRGDQPPAGRPAAGATIIPTPPAISAVPLA